MEIYSKSQNMDQDWKEVRNSGDKNIGFYNVLRFNLQEWKIFSMYHTG